MVVLVIMALAVTGIRYGLATVTRARLRGACMKVMAATQYAYHRALSQGNTVRVVFDLKRHTFRLEEAAGTLGVGQAKQGDAADQNDAIDPWEQARLKLAEFDRSQGSQEVVSPFGPLVDDSGETLPQGKAQPVGDGVRIAALMVPHAIGPQRKGRVSVYFYPGGHGQHAVVQLQDASKRIYSVELDALTGGATVHTKAVRPRPPLDVDDF